LSIFVLSPMMLQLFLELQLRNSFKWHHILSSVS
jgi:hypothetical protein